MSGLISARTARSPALVTRLAERARVLAMARAETIYRARRSDAGRWRKARLLWPLFGGEG